MYGFAWDWKTVHHSSHFLAARVDMMFQSVYTNDKFHVSKRDDFDVLMIHNGFQKNERRAHTIPIVSRMQEQNSNGAHPPIPKNEVPRLRRQSSSFLTIFLGWGGKSTPPTSPAGAVVAGGPPPPPPSPACLPARPHCTWRVTTRGARRPSHSRGCS